MARDTHWRAKGWCGMTSEAAASTSASDGFVVRISVAKVDLLAKDVVPAAASADDPVYVYYSLFSTDINTAHFLDVDTPVFQPEDMTFVLRSSLDEIKEYLSPENSLRLFLCRGDHAFATASVSLADLASDQRRVALTCDMHKLAPSPGDEQPQPQQPPDRQAVARLHVTASIDHVADVTAEAAMQSQDASQQTAATAVDDAASGADAAAAVVDPVPVSALLPPGADAAAQPVPLPTPALLGMSRDQVTASMRARHGTEIPATAVSPASPAKPRSAPASSVATGARHWRCSIDLRAVHDLSVLSAANVYLRYHIPQFDLRVRTRPPFPLRRHEHAGVQDGFRAVQLDYPAAALPSLLGGNVLSIELWHCDRYAADVCLGTAKVSWSDLLAAPQHTTPAGYPARALDRVVTVASDLAPHVAKLHVVLGIEDLGPVDGQANLAPPPEEQALQRNTAQHQQSPLQAAPQRDAAQLKQLEAELRAELRPQLEREVQQQLEYRAAWELEMWRRDEEARWRAELTKREQQVLHGLQEQWRVRDAEREKDIAAQRRQLDVMSEKLTKKAAELERRESSIASSEAAVQRERTLLEQDRERMEQGFAERARLAEDAHKHAMRMEAEQRSHIEKQLAASQEREAGARATIQSLEAAVAAARSAALEHAKPQQELLDRVAAANAQVAEMRSQRDDAVAARDQYKEHLMRALRELRRLRQANMAEKQAHLESEKRQLSQLRLEIAAKEEREAILRDRNQIEALKQELGVASDTPGASLNVRHEIDRLKKERALLLQTGVYQASDRVIAAIDSRLAQLAKMR